MTLNLSDGKKRRLSILVGLFTLVLVAGIIIGTALGGSDSSSAAKPAPQTTTYVTQAPIEKTVNKAVTPDECVSALDEADEGFNLAAESSNEFKNAVTAIQNGDVEGINTAAENIQKLNGQLNKLAPRYNAHKTICRAAAE